MSEAETALLVPSARYRRTVVLLLLALLVLLNVCLLASCVVLQARTVSPRSSTLSEVVSGSNWRQPGEYLEGWSRGRAANLAGSLIVFDVYKTAFSLQYFPALKSNT